MGVGGQRHAPAAVPPGKTRYPLYKRLGGPQGRSGRMRKNPAPAEIRSPPVASGYTDWATLAHILQTILHRHYGGLHVTYVNLISLVKFQRYIHFRLQTDS
jgi:hypothetical protein